MTRFARAKGSKSSNEKKPEEATSWSEMRRSIISKPSKEPEKITVKPEVKEVKPVQTEWGSLGDENSQSLLKQSLGKNEKKRKGKKLKPENCEEGDTTVKKKVKKKNSSLNPETDEVVKKKKKRKLDEDNLKEQLVKKKRKNDNSENADNKKIEKKLKNKKKDLPRFEKKSKKFENKFSNKRNSFQKTRNFDRNSIVEELIVNGEKIPIVKFQGFNVTLDDADRLKKLRQDMIKEGIPKNKLEAAIKLERRRAEKALARLKKAVCFHCRGYGHLLSNCPNLTEKQNTSTGICYKCGSTEHTAFECKVVRGTNFQFAECFICKEQGHIARQCPDNPRGLYPQGGACRECGDVTHLRKDCPQVVSKKVEESVTVGLRNDRNLECLDEEIASKEKKIAKKPSKKNTAVVF